MFALRILLGLVGFTGFLIWPVLCVVVAMLPKFQIGPPDGPGMSPFEISFYIVAPLLAFVYYAVASIAIPRRSLAIVGVALHLFLIGATPVVTNSVHPLIIVPLTVGGILSFWYESQSFSQRTA
jgi:hypothetical protein